MNLKNNLYSYKNFTELNEFEIQLIHNERNQIEVRKMMFNHDIISFEQHKNFVLNLKSDKSKIFLLVKRDNEYVGVYSIVNISNQNGQGGFYLFEQARKKNLAIEFLYYTISFVFSNYPVTCINGFALRENKAANKINKFFGFNDSTPSKSNEQYVYSEMHKLEWENNIIEKKNIVDLVLHTIKSQI
jgi:UDP-4-amino-4,6-dideoxy-N-acetyl-beta-L-altrosamine N-acetyltransferase